MSNLPQMIQGLMGGKSLAGAQAPGAMAGAPGLGFGAPAGPMGMAQTPGMGLNPQAVAEGLAMAGGPTGMAAGGAPMAQAGVAPAADTGLRQLQYGGAEGANRPHMQNMPGFLVDEQGRLAGFGRKPQTPARGAEGAEEMAKTLR